MSAVATAIAQAARQARRKMETLNTDAEAQLRALYEQIIALLQEDLRRSGDAQGTLTLELLTHFLRQAQARWNRWAPEQEKLLLAAIDQAATIGASIWGVAGGVPAAGLPALADAAARFVIQFTAADGLRLSDRLWRLENGAIQQIAEALRRNILLGRDASRAAADLLGQPLPLELQRQLGLNRVEALEKPLADVLMRDPNNAYSRMLRVLRTEMNRAQGEAYRAGAGAHPDVIGERFVLSPNHPKTDVCDDYARADRYGLGPGVYPVGKAPWPAHPNTMSYLEAVFADEMR